MFDIGKIFTAPFTNLGDNVTRPFEDPASMFNPVAVLGFDEDEENKVDAEGRGEDGFIEVAYRKPDELTPKERTNEISSD